MKKKETKAEEPVFLNPRTDFGFKKIFGDSELLIAFLNGVMPDAHIKSVEYKPTEQLGDRDKSRKAVYDLLCTDENGKYILVEMQNVQQRFFADRALFYSSCLIRNQAPRRKKWNYELKAVCVISILNFVLSETIQNESPDEQKSVIERVALVNEQTKQTFSDKLKFIYIQLPNFTKKWGELESNFDYWMYMLRHLEKFTRRPQEVQDYIFKRLFHLAQYNKLNTEEMEAYKKSILEYDDVRDAVLFAEERAEQRGFIIGEQRGISLGVRQRNREVVIRCYTRGMSVDEIADMTGLPVKEIKAIVEN